MNGPRQRGSLRKVFWPAVLILAGLLALLINLNLIPTDRLYLLADLWPLVLIVAGLILLIRRTPMPAARATAATVAVVILAIAGSALYVALGPAVPGEAHSLSVREPVRALKEATLEIETGAATVHVQGSSSMVEDLVQARITYSGQIPTITVDYATGRVVIAEKANFGFLGRRSMDLWVQLNSAVRWHLATHSGASTESYDVANLDIADLEVDTGASTEDISLGFPRGSVTVNVNGGALTVHLHRDSRSAASVKVSGGAVSLDYDGRSSSGFGSLEGTSGDSADLFAITVNGGACHVTMDTGA